MPSDCGQVVTHVPPRTSKEVEEDILVPISKHLPTVPTAVDYFAKSWKSITTSNPFNLLIPQPPFLMLAEEKGVAPRRGFVGLNSCDKVYKLHLPELHQRVNRKLAIARPGDNSWSPIQTRIPAVAAVDDVIYFKNQFYNVNRCGKVAVCHYVSM
ncbi:hypothetical protein IFM89_037670 [Coptis chinensis]|uniref:KIB1-4 beta-propeller domain-containing protein n=1 Tax=Coptis chinensis TaxID=261450 RepID=A0A835IJI0_9MAGN|nr:hypothetical protein IFM89_037670 [Coptis chinensis]